MTARSTLATLLPISALLSAAGVASADHDHRDRGSVVTVQGEATVTRTPDEARIEIGVQTEDDNSERAADLNANKVDAVLRALKKIAGRKAKIRTLGYTLQPRYRYRERSGREIIGYTASNSVEVQTSDLNRVGRLIEAAIASGANEVRGLQFKLADDISARAEALAEATSNAEVKARAIAGALGIELGPVLEVTEGGAHVAPRHRQVYADAAMSKSSREAPVEPGTIDVQGSVTLVFSVQR